MLSINRKVRVLVVDDSAVARTFLTRGLSSYPNIEVVGYAVTVSYTHLTLPTTPYV